MKEIIGRKMGMTQVYAEDGTMYAVTVIEVLPNVVTQKKTLEKDGYEALQVGYEPASKPKNLNRCEQGIYKKANVEFQENLYEIQGDELASYEVGQSITCDIFKANDLVDVIGTSKGRGYAGTIKRRGHTIGPKGHGSGYHRGQGSFANNGRCNNRVIPGKKMSGHMGNQSATVLAQPIVAVNKESNYILIKGGVPGPKKSIVKIRTTVKDIKHPKTVQPIINRLPKVEEVASEEVATEQASN